MPLISGCAVQVAQNAFTEVSGVKKTILHFASASSDIKDNAINLMSRLSFQEITTHLYSAIVVPSFCRMPIHPLQRFTC